MLCRFSISRLLLHSLSPIPFTRAVCTGGLSDFSTNDGTRKLLQLSQEMEETIVTYDAWGNLISPEHRFLQDGCPLTFTKPDCIGTCAKCTGVNKVKCRARQLACKGSSIEGLKLPFLSDPMKVIGLFSGGDIE